MSMSTKISKLAAKGLKRAGLLKAATLTVVTPGTRQPGAVSAGTNPTRLDYSARGLVIKWTKKRLNETDVQANDRVVKLLGALIASGKVPKVNDEITIDGVTSRIVDIDREGDGAAYNCLTRK